MKIYQLHKYGGVWEDAFDDIIGTYLYRIRAEEEKAKAELKDEEDKELAHRCSDCPLVNGWSFDKRLVGECEKYCDKFKYIDMPDGDLSCENYIVHWDDIKFRIEEVEVIG